MTPHDFYDVIVLGSDLGGVVAGALLARRGYRVLWACGDLLPDRYTVGGHTLLRSPSPLVPLESPPLRRVLSDLNLLQTLRRRLTPQQPCYHLALPDSRLDIGDHAEANREELARELPDAAEAIARLGDAEAEHARLVDSLLGQELTLPPTGFWERRELGRATAQLDHRPSPLAALDSLPPGHGLRAAVALPATLLADAAPESLSPLAICRAGELLRRGCYRLDEGGDGLRELCGQRVSSQSGDVRRDYQPAELLLHHGKVAGVRLRGRREELGCNFVVVGTTTRGLSELIADERLRRRLQRDAAADAVAFRYVLNLVLGAEAIPTGMQSTLFCAHDPGRPLCDDNAFGVQVGAADAQGCVIAQVYAPSRNDQVEALRALRQRLLEHLAEVIPFFERHLLFAHSPHDGLPPAGPAAPSFAGEASPPEPLFRPRGGVLGVGGSQIPTGINRLFLCGRENLPGLGLEGQLSAALSVSRLIAARETKKDLLRREVLR